MHFNFLKTINKTVAAGFIVTTSMLAGCANLEGVNEVQGGQLVGNGANFTANPIVIPIHGQTGSHENLRPLYEKIEDVYAAVSHISTLIPEDRGTMTSTHTIEQQAIAVYNDIRPRLMHIINNYGGFYEHKIPVHLLGLSQGTQVALELLNILRTNNFLNNCDIKIFGVNSVFDGVHFRDHQNFPTISWIVNMLGLGGNGLDTMTRESCRARITQVQDLINPRTCHLVASRTNDMVAYFRHFTDLGPAQLGAMFFNPMYTNIENDGLLSVANQTGSGQNIVQVTSSIIPENNNHVALHGWAPGTKNRDLNYDVYAENVFGKYIEFLYQE
jgi:hypothetical protein